ncbi:hypothetical protein BDP67DRAFT_222500 [Colletotrichum lupini]|nr:hypothetical protein BDP67DRAFT_222500 [Colletotrichum lupini]
MGRGENAVTRDVADILAGKALFFSFCSLFLSLALRVSMGGSDTFFFFFLHNTVGDLGVDMAFIRILLLLSFLEASDTYFPLLQPRVSGFFIPYQASHLFLFFYNFLFF